MAPGLNALTRQQPHARSSSPTIGRSQSKSRGTTAPAQRSQLAESERALLMTNGYAGPGIWIRITHRFGPRMTEWFMAGHMIVFGYVLLLSSDTFNQPAFHAFRELVPSEDSLGWAMLLVGCVRVIGLVINGAKKTVTPQIRVFSAGIGCMIWSGIAYGFLSSDVVSTWLAIYPLFAVSEIVNIYRAAHDQGEIRNGTTG